MRLLFFVLVIILGIFVEQGAAKDYIKLASWNIENLGKRTLGQNRFAIAEYLHLAGMDVLALQEIHDTDGDGAPYKNAKLDQVFTLLNERDGQTWKYELFPKRKADETFQLCGVAWNAARVKKVGSAFKIPVDHQNNSLWDRHPYAVKFQVIGNRKNDFVIVPVHMKSNVRSHNAQFDPETRRSLEADALADVFDNISSHFKDDDLIVLGDTNCLSADEDALVTLSGLGLRDLNGKEARTYVSGASFDHILVPDDQPEFRYSRQYILSPADSRSYDKTISDHFLIMTSIQVMNDDDIGDTESDSEEGITENTLSSMAIEYYREIDDSENGRALKEKLHRLTRNNRTLTYRQLWDAIAYTDESEDDSSKVVLFYTGWLRDKNDHGGNPSEWNREHVWAKSKGNFGTRPGAGTDLHHIRPTDVSVNSARGSLSFDSGGNVYRDPDGPTTNHRDNNSWDPREEVKGDVARMLFYMVVRYEEPSLDLELVDRTIPQQSRAPKLGKLSTLLQWHKDDPPSPFEKRRNERIQERQGNRNPFIDHPEWVPKIWRQP